MATLKALVSFIGTNRQYPNAGMTADPASAKP